MRLKMVRAPRFVGYAHIPGCATELRREGGSSSPLLDLEHGGGSRRNHFNIARGARSTAALKDI